MIPMGKLVGTESNIYELTSAIIRRAYQLGEIRRAFNTGEGETVRDTEGADKVVSQAITELLTGEVRFELDKK